VQREVMRPNDGRVDVGGLGRLMMRLLAAAGGPSGPSLNNFLGPDNAALRRQSIDANAGAERLDRSSNRFR
jgi:hypothetical protein